MRCFFITLFFFLFLLPPLRSQENELILGRVASHWLEQQHHFEDTAEVWGDYTLDLTLEALLLSDVYFGQDVYWNVVAEVFRKRKIKPHDTIPYTSQPFCSINFTLGKITGDSRWYRGFIAESYRMDQEVKRSPEGAILLYHQGRHALVIDYIQEVASRLARTGYLTGDSSLFTKSISQFRICEKILRDPSTGLWSQGRGWCRDTSLVSEGAWSRGHGWLLRGLVTTLLHLPEEKRKELLPLLERTGDALRKVQSPSGMFHILLNLPPEKSAPDVSGTGMIAYYLSLAVEKGWLDAEAYAPLILRATAALPGFVTEKGEILSSSKGPGPLCFQDEYRGYVPDLDEKHGFQGVIYGMMAEKRMQKQAIPGSGGYRKPASDKH
jgi:rhamnogalacturonyl hydrolase YesR